MIEIKVISTGDTVHVSVAHVAVGLSADNAETFAMMLLREADKARKNEQPQKVCFVPHGTVVRERG